MPQNSIILLAMLAMICLIVTNGEESKKQRMQKFLSTRQEELKKWEDLQMRSCDAKAENSRLTDVMNNCFRKKIEECDLKGNEEAKNLYLAAYDNCIKESPFKDICDKNESKNRILCYIQYAEDKLDQFNGTYQKDDGKYKDSIGELYKTVYTCFDTKVTELSKKS